MPKSEVLRQIKSVGAVGLDGRAVPGGAGLKGPVHRLGDSDEYFSAPLDRDPPQVVLYSREEVDEFAGRGLLTLLPSAEQRAVPWIRNGVVIYADTKCVDVLRSAFGWGLPPGFLEDTTARLIWSYERMDEAFARLANWTRRLLQRIRLEIKGNADSEQLLTWLAVARYCALPRQAEMRREVLGLSLVTLERLGREDAADRLRRDIRLDGLDPERVAVLAKSIAEGRPAGAGMRVTRAPIWAAAGRHPAEAST